MRIKSNWVVIPLLLVAGVTQAQEVDLQPLIAGLSSGEKPACLEAADGLAHLGAESAAAVPALTDALKSNDAEVCWHVCRALGAIGEGSAASVPALTEALKSEDGKVRAYAAYALGQIGQAAMPAVDGLIEIAFDEDPIVRRAAGRAIRKIDPPQEKTLPHVLKILQAGDPSIIMPALSTFAEQGKEAVPRLRNLLEDEQACYWACVVLAEIGPDAAEAVPDVQKVLAHADPDVRLQALLALGEIGGAAASAAPDIVKVLQGDDYPQVRVAAAYALGKIAAPGQTDALVAAQESDQPFLRMVSAWALARIQPDDPAVVQRAMKLILAALSSDDDVLQSGAARALAELEAGSDEAIDALVEVLEESDPYVVGNAIDALAALGPDVVDDVLPGLQQPKLRNYSVRVLYRLGPDGAAAVPALIDSLRAEVATEADEEFRREVFFALAAIGPGATAAAPALDGLLADDSEDVRAAAAYTLGKIGPGAEDAVAKLVEMVRNGDERMKRVAVWALMRIRPDEERLKPLAVETMTKALSSDQEVARVEAALMLGELGEHAKSAVEPLKALLADPSPNVRRAVAEALKKLEQ